MLPDAHHHIPAAHRHTVDSLITQGNLFRPGKRRYPEGIFVRGFLDVIEQVHPRIQLLVAKGVEQRHAARPAGRIIAQIIVVVFAVLSETAHPHIRQAAGKAHAVGVHVDHAAGRTLRRAGELAPHDLLHLLTVLHDKSYGIPFKEEGAAPIFGLEAHNILPLPPVFHKQGGTGMRRLFLPGSL